MGKYDERPKVDIEVSDGKIVLDGKKLELQQGQFKSLRFKVSKLCKRTYNSVDDGKARSDTRIAGLATTEDRISIVGMPETTYRVGFSVRGLNVGPEGEDSHLLWTAHMGFIAGSWEIDSADQWYLECYVPIPVAEELIRSYDAGRIADMSIGLKTELWSRWDPFPHSGSTEWHMLADKYGSTAGTTAKIDGLHWSDAALDKIDTAPPVDEEPEDRHPTPPAAQPESPLAGIMLAGTRASEKLARTWAWGMPAIVILLAIIAARM